jgi:hypothetical protein
LHNGGNVAVNIVSSNFVLVPGSQPLADNVCLTGFNDSNGGGAPSNDLLSLSGFVDPSAGCVTLSKMAVAMGSGSSFWAPSGIFIPAGGDAWIDMTLGFRSEAGNDTIGKTAGFTWELTARQVPKNVIP